MSKPRWVVTLGAEGERAYAEKMYGNQNLAVAIGGAIVTPLGRQHFMKKDEAIDWALYVASVSGFVPMIRNV